jgi:quercetin dioxygenase-like cupin family protein
MSARTFDFSPALDLRFEVRRSAADTGGELIEYLNVSGPGMSAPPLHIHPGASETYEVVAGEIEVFSEGRWQRVPAGSSLTVEAGQPHTVRNASDSEARVINVHRPALDFERFFETFHLLIKSGKVKRLPPKDPRSLLYMAMLFAAHEREQITVRPPQRVIRVLARVGRLLGYRLPTPRA